MPRLKAIHKQKQQQHRSHQNRARSHSSALATANQVVEIASYLPLLVQLLLACCVLILAIGLPVLIGIIITDHTAMLDLITLFHQ